MVNSMPKRAQKTNHKKLPIKIALPILAIGLALIAASILLSRDISATAQDTMF